MSTIRYRGYRFPPEIIQHAIWLYLRFALSFRDIEDLLAERGIILSHETIWRWVIHFGPRYAKKLRRQRWRPGRTWHLDEVFVSIGGRPMYLWRAVDQEDEILDVVVQPKRDKRAAVRLMRKLLKKRGLAPREIVTDHLRSYGAAFRVLRLSAEHGQEKQANNRAESLHVPIRRRERRMRGFRSSTGAQRFLSSHAAVYNILTVCRHLTTAKTHRILRGEAFTASRAAVRATG
jgi:putative transposase